MTSSEEEEEEEDEEEEEEVGSVERWQHFAAREQARETFLMTSELCRNFLTTPGTAFQSLERG